MTTRRLAEWVSSLAYEDLPEEVVLKAKRVLFACLGATIFTAAQKQWGKVITEFATIHGGGQPESTIIGSGRKTLAVQAALANGTMAEGFELGDVHAATATRPFPMIVPAALALGEARGQSGKTLIEAIVAGYEVNTRVGMAVRPEQRGRPMLGRGLYLPSLVGTFGGTAAAGKVLGLATQEMTWALGIAGALTGGYFQGHEEGAWTRRLNGGMTPARAVTAALLGERGFVGPEKPLEGEYGFYRVFANNEFDPEALTANLGGSYLIMESWLKAYPMNATLHGPVEALLALMHKHDLKHTDIEAIAAGWHQYVTILAKKEVHTIVSAQFSLPFALAVASVRRKATVDEFTEETLKDPVVKAMIGRVEVAYDASLFERVGGESLPGSVTVTTRDGRVLKEEVLYPKGHPRNPMSLDEMREKFAVLTEGALTPRRQKEVFDRVMELEKITDIGALLALCTIDTLA